MELLIALLSGLALGGVLASFLFQRTHSRERRELVEERMRAEREWGEQRVRLERELASSASELAHLHELTGERIRTQAELEKRHAEDLVLQEKRLAERFELLARKALQENSAAFREESKQGVQGVLEPLRERLNEFQKKVDESYTVERSERLSLKSELQRMLELNTRMSQEANNLTRALRGDVKAQGNWGEVILERLLQVSGLREGHEYTRQGKDLGLVDESNRRQLPDIILNLPDNKHLVVDAKVSLVSYERYISEGDDGARAKHLRQFMDSLYAHVRDLHEKRYHGNEKLRAPEFTFLFLPIEGAFSTALQSDADLYNFSWERHVVLVSPTTMLATLRTVSSLWRLEHQNRHAKRIAEEAGALYDKFADHVKDLESIRIHLNRAFESHDSAMNKLSTGRGNLIKKVHNLRVLGAKASKPIPGLDAALESADNLEVDDAWAAQQPPVPVEIPSQERTL